MPQLEGETNLEYSRRLNIEYIHCKTGYPKEVIIAILLADKEYVDMLLAEFDYK